VSSPRLVGQVAHQVEDLDLVTQVEVGGGLVEQQHCGVLRQAAREPHALQLAAGQGVDTALGEVRHARDGHGVRDDVGTVGVTFAPPPAVGVPAEPHDVVDADPGRDGAALRQHRDPAGEVPAGQRQRVGTVPEQDLTRGGPV